MKNIFTIILAGLLTGLLSSCITTFTPTKVDTTSTVSQIQVAKFGGFGEWKGRSLYSFFEDIYEKGISPTSLEGEIFAPDTDRWHVKKASDGFNQISIKVPQLYDSIYGGFAVEGTYGYNQAFQNWDSGFPFPADEAEFVIDGLSDKAYVKGQNFVNYVMYTGYEEGFIEWSGDITNNIRMHTFITADGLKEISTTK